MNKPVIVYLDDAGTSFYKQDGTYVGVCPPGLQLEEYKEKATEVVELAQLGYTADDIIKLKSVGAL